MEIAFHILLGLLKSILIESLEIPSFFPSRKERTHVKVIICRLVPVKARI